MNALHIWTSDNLRLMGLHYSPQSESETCILFIHGMSGNFIEDYFGDVLGKHLAESGFGFIYAHNRGYNHINDIDTKEKSDDGGYKSVRMGAMYERFADCIYDIEGWLNKVEELGYTNIILMGHSLGCNKIIHYYHQAKPNSVSAVILASAADIVGLFEKPEYQPNHKELFAEAQRNIQNDQPRKLVTGKIWDWYKLSSQTYLGLSTPNTPVDNLPVLRNPEKWAALASVDVPILGIMGEHDDIAIRTLEADFNLIQSKAASCPQFNQAFISGANHSYVNQEQQFADVVVNWVKLNQR